MNNMGNMQGTYTIICIYSQRNYVGASCNVIRRIKEHINAFRKNVHPISELQQDWNNFGEESFEFSIGRGGINENVLELDQKLNISQG